MIAMLKKFWSQEEGAALVEYGLLLGLIAVIVIFSVTQLGTKVSTKFDTIQNAL